MGLVPTKRYADLLGDGLETLLAKGVDRLEDLADGLDALAVRPERGPRWTPATLVAEMQRLTVDNEPVEQPVTAQPVPRRTQPFPPAPATPEELLETGLLNLWYLIARSSDVRDRPVALTRLGRHIVLWRDDAGNVCAIEDYCPHRGAPLSLGRVFGNDVRCAYHGVQVDAGGTITAVPPTPGCPLVGQRTNAVYPVVEQAGAIFAFIGDGTVATPPPPIFPEEITSNEWTTFLFTTQWRCNWQIALDNRVDPIHGSYLHAGTFTLAYGRQDSELIVKPTAHGFETFRNNQRGVNIDWHDVAFYPGNALWVKTEIPYPPMYGGSFTVNGHPTPIDAESTYVWFFRSRKCSGWQRDLWRFLYKNRLEERSFEVVEQDRVMLEAIPLAARGRERLIQTDIAVGRMRRLLREEATRQLAGSATTVIASR